MRLRGDGTVRARGGRLLALATSICVLGAANQSAPHRAARQVLVTGVVYDSVAHVGLAGALVQLVATSSAGAPVRLGTLSDSAGRFVFPSVERGRFVVGFFHPKLDSLGVEAPLAQVEISGEANVAIDLAVPSIATVLHRACGPGATRDSSGAMVGFVRGAATGMAVGGAAVRARWSEITIDARDGARLRVRESLAHAGDDGWFVMCRVPAGGLVLVSAGDSGATLEVNVPTDGLLVRDLYVPAPAPAAGTIRGTVRDPYDAPIGGVRIRLWGEVRETRSNAQGEFVLAGLPTGTRMLELRAIGFAPRRELVDVRTHRDVIVDLPLEEFPTTIDTVRVFGSANGGDDRLAGFVRRQALGQGVFLDPEAVERRQPLSFTDLLRGISGVAIGHVRGARTALMRSPDGISSCEPELVVDGMRMPRYDSSLDDLIPASVVRAVEVYPRRVRAPAEYQSLSCGTVVIWTGARGWLAKRGRDGKGRP